MRLSLCIDGLRAGGAERVLSHLANHFARTGHAVSLVTLASPREDFYPLDAAVERIGAGERPRPAGHALAALFHNARAVAFLRRALARTRPDVAVSFIDAANVRAALATRGLGVPLVISERIDPSQHALAPPWPALRRLTYPLADALVVQSAPVARWAERLVPRARVHVIPNPVLAPALPDGEREPMVIAMGRLHRQKGFDVLLDAFARVRAPGWQLVILGEGAERARLEAAAHALGIADRVRLPGLEREPARWLARAALFVLASRYEGFPNALVEAMACGLPVVATDCPSGPAEIVRPGVDGWLVPPDDPRALAAAMQPLIDSRELRTRLGASAREVCDRFGAATIMQRWEELLGTIRMRRRRRN